jgi:ABC-type sugar transport system permease subunit
MVIPAILTLLFFSLYPLLYSLALSVSDSQLARPFRAFIAFKNYSDAIADTLFRSSIELTFIYAFGVTLIETAIGFGLALLLNQESSASRFARTLGLLPFITPPVAIAAIWRLIYDRALPWPLLCWLISGNGHHLSFYCHWLSWLDFHMNRMKRLLWMELILGSSSFTSLYRFVCQEF